MWVLYSVTVSVALSISGSPPMLCVCLSSSPSSPLPCLASRLAPHTLSPQPPPCGPEDDVQLQLAISLSREEHDKVRAASLPSAGLPSDPPQVPASLPLLAPHQSHPRFTHTLPHISSSRTCVTWLLRWVQSQHGKQMPCSCSGW